MGLEQKTYEGKASVRNGILRLILVIAAMSLEVALIVIVVSRLNKNYQWIAYATRALTFLLVMAIYSQHRTASMKMPWIILILVTPVFGIVMYLLVGLNRSTYMMRQRYEKIDMQLFPLLIQSEEVDKRLYQQNPPAHSISRYLEMNANYPVYQNTDVKYFDDAEKALESQLKDLAKAQKFIFLDYYAIEDKESWKRVEDVLVERVKAGVEVRVFYDDMGSISFITTDFVQKMENLGIKCRVFNPFAPFLNAFLNNRNHQKITVIDGRIGYTGGYNLANEYFNVTHPYGQWKDTGIRLEGDAVRSMTVTVLEMWNAVKHHNTVEDDLSVYLEKPDYHALEKGFVQPYADNPMDDEQTGENVYISMADKAHDYCYFITPYLIITDELSHALSLAAKRGVDVRIITPGIPDKKIVYNVTRSFYNQLTRNGVRIFEWNPGFCHAKMSVADDRMATCGTINLDYRSLYHHFEDGCFMVDCQAVKDIKADFDHLFTECREVTDDYTYGRKAYLRFGQLFLRLFAELL